MMRSAGKDTGRATAAAAVNDHMREEEEGTCTALRKRGDGRMPALLLVRCCPPASTVNGPLEARARRGAGTAKVASGSPHVAAHTWQPTQRQPCNGTPPVGQVVVVAASRRALPSCLVSVMANGPPRSWPKALCNALTNGASTSDHRPDFAAS